MLGSSVFSECEGCLSGVTVQCQCQCNTQYSGLQPGVQISEGQQRCLITTHYCPAHSNTLQHTGASLFYRVHHSRSDQARDVHHLHQLSEVHSFMWRIMICESTEDWFTAMKQVVWKILEIRNKNVPLKLFKLK